jgi:hypothetical protein
MAAGKRPVAAKYSGAVEPEGEYCHPEAAGPDHDAQLFD